MIHVAECLYSKCETLSSKLSIKKKSLNFFFFNEELCLDKFTHFVYKEHHLE
jgi:hypothetical protein